MMNVRRLIITVVIVLLLGTLFTAGFHSLAAAQNKSKATGNKKRVSELPPEMVGERASELLLSINDSIASVKSYEREMAGASAEDRLVLQLQIYQMRIRIIDDIHQLADALLELEKAGPEPELRGQVEDVFARVTPRLWFHIDRFRGEINKIRARRIEAKVEERFAIENEVANFTRRLDTFYEISLAHITKMEQVGMDVKEARENFILQLYDRADELSGRLELALVRIDELETQLKETPDDTNVFKLLLSVKKSLDTNSDGMDVIIGLMETLELDTAVYRAQLLTATRDISSGLLGTGVAINLLGTTLKKAAGWLVDSGPSYLLKLLLFVGIIFVFRFLKRVVRRGLEKAIDASDLDLSQLARRMIISTVSNLVMLFGILVALSQLGISLGPLLAGLGVAGFIIGFALQDTLGNFAAGMMILLYRPYDMGDLIDVGDVFGKVDKMSLVSTSLLTLDNQLFVVPNSKIWGDVIKNVTAQETRRVDMVFGISYSDDIPKAESILEDILQSHDKVLDMPEPMVRLHTLGASSVDFVVRPWVKVDDYWDVYWDVTRTVKLRFDEEGVSIPFPQRDVHVYNQNLLAGEAT
ncbi:MAG: mechanosensitive ion channel [Desulfobacterales bacterium]|nr:MAG: mechanosensitive ion channel [Desulfobacterales bacterium]